MAKAERTSSIELMRIVCMVLIVMHHYAVHTVWEVLPQGNLNLVRLLRAWAPVAINCFVMITGYFGVFSSTNVKSKIIRICRDRWFYAVSISILMLALGMTAWNIQYFFRAVFPIITCRHNYVTTFVMLYLFIPFLNKFIHSLSEKEFRYFIFLMTLVTSFWPTTLTLTGLYTNNVYSYLLWMMYIYCVGAFLRMNEDVIKSKNGVWSLLLLIFIAFQVLMEIVIEPSSSLIPQSYTSTTRHGIAPLLTSVVLFCFFISLRLRKSKLVNEMASSMFAVLLIHDDPLIRSVLWSKILSCASYSSSEYLWIHALISVILVFVVCIVIDKIYVYVIQRGILWGYHGCKKMLIKRQRCLNGTKDIGRNDEI